MSATIVKPLERCRFIATVAAFCLAVIDVATGWVIAACAVAAALTVASFVAGVLSDRAASHTPEVAASSDVSCCVCGGGPVVYHNYKEQPFCWPCADCGCCQDVCVRTGINAKAESAAPDLGGTS